MPKDLLRAVARLTMAIVSTTTVLAVLPAAHAGNSSSLRSSTVAAPVADPAVKGPLATVRATYQLGNTALRVPTGYKVELAGEVTYPKALGRTRRPLVVLVPGAHAPCGRADGDKDDAWPCAKGFRPIPSERGFRPLADLLASHGMIVVSIAVNGVNAQDGNSDDEGRGTGLI